MSHSFGIQVTLKAVKDKGDYLAQIMLDAAQLIENLPGCQAYIVIRSMSDPDLVLITEIWDCQQTHQASLANKEVASLINSTRSLITHMEHHAGRPLNGKNSALRPVCA
ncbi:MAG: putative quinol monooxygenase [Marinicella sp.]